MNIGSSYSFGTRFSVMYFVVLGCDAEQYNDVPYLELFNLSILSHVYYITSLILIPLASRNKNFTKHTFRSLRLNIQFGSLQLCKSISFLTDLVD